MLKGSKMASQCMNVRLRVADSRGAVWCGAGGAAHVVFQTEKAGQAQLDGGLAAAGPCFTKIISMR